MGWFLALLAALGLLFGGRMLQQPRVQQQSSPGERLQHQQNENERLVEDVLARYPDVREQANDEEIQDLLVWARWLDNPDNFADEEYNFRSSAFDMRLVDQELLLYRARFNRLVGDPNQKIGLSLKH